ncbi:Protein of unknown function [Rhizobiales bacterium GAS191]|nr:Protein of unknown function [Rhizobiales bacterium GAS113]SEC16608.1 Protein of unknown function [Rhizobiales bacterium GAS191]
MFRRTLFLAIALSGAIAASQLPEFTQQYAQRLGGAVDELKRVVQRFDADSVAVGEDRKSALTRLARSSDELARRQSSAMLINIARLDALQAQQAEMATTGPFGRIQAFLSDPDPDVAEATWNAFQPGVPATGEGAATGGAGFLVGGGLMAGIGRLFRRRPGLVAAR